MEWKQRDNEDMWTCKQFLYFCLQRVDIEFKDEFCGTNMAEGVRRCRWKSLQNSCNVKIDEVCHDGVPIRIQPTQKYEHIEISLSSENVICHHCNTNARGYFLEIMALLTIAITIMTNNYWIISETGPLVKAVFRRKSKTHNEDDNKETKQNEFVWNLPGVP